MDALGFGAGLGCLALLLTGCVQPASRTIGIGPSDVDAVEVHQYAWEPEPDTVSVAVVRDRREIEVIVAAFTDMPVRELTHTRNDLLGARAAGLRFLLRDGGTVGLTQVFVEPADVVVFWQDGSVDGTPWGSAIGDLPTPADPAANTPSDASRVPPAVVP